MKVNKLSIITLVTIFTFVAGNAYAAKYWRGSCTKNWTQKFSTYKSCVKATKAHEKSTGHNSGCLGPY